VRNFAASRLLEDIYAYNDFTHDGVRAALADPVRVTKDRTSPYMVTEHTGHMFPCLPDDPISVRTEHALRHARVLDAMYAHERISGAIGWCMSDYQTSARFGGGDGVCHHGVCDMFRIPKLAAAVYASQQENMPVLQVCGDLRIGSYPAHAIGTVWVFTNCERVELMFRGQRVGWHEADRVRFGHLPHPPVAITDLIGERINELDGFSPGERKLLREVLNQAALTGFDLPVLRKISVALLMRRHGLSGADAIELFERFVLWWDGEDPVWEFRGYRGTQVVARTVLRPSGGSRLDLCADSAVMEELDTYDVVRLVVSMRSDTGMLQWMSHAPVHIDVTGPARLLGPSEISLCGGSAGLYIRSIGKPGNVRVTVSSPSCEPAGTSIRVD
jgi:beta-galactosidase